MANEDSFTFCFDDSFTVDDVDSYVSKLQYDDLENLELTFDGDSTSLQHNLRECLSSCNCKLLEEKVFSKTIPVVRRLLFKIVERINETLSSNFEGSNVDLVEPKLSVCNELLNFCEKCVEHVSKLRNVPVTDVKSLPENVPDTMKLIFEHCKTSSKAYGSLFDVLSNELTNLFRKANTILKLFLATLEGVIVFDTDTESETELLVKVINEIGSIASVVNGMDLKTHVEMTKAFGKLAISNQHDVKRVSSKGVSTNLHRMTKDVSVMLSTLQDSREGIEERSIKATGLLLKILDKLFGAFYSCVDFEVLLSVVELLLRIHRCSPSCLRNSDINDKTIDTINVNISLGSEALLNTILKNTEFKQAYFDYGMQTDIDRLGFYLLTIDILKKLTGTPYEYNFQWTLGAESIVDFALTNINSVQEEICAGEIRLPGAHEIGERPRYASLYEATLVPICSLISQIPPEGFHAIELLLLKHLLSNRLWSSLLSSDIWCFVGRISSSSVCVNHVKYLLKVRAALAKRHSSLEVVLLDSLIGRLYTLLSEETRHSLAVELDDTDACTWAPIARYLPSRTRSFLRNRLAPVFDGIPKTFGDLLREPNARNWDRFVHLLSIMGKLDHTLDKGTVDVLSEIWNSIGSTIEDFEGKKFDILSDFIAVVLNAVQPGNIQNDAYLMIFETIVTSSLCFSSYLKVVTSHYMRNNANSFGNCDLKTATVLAELNCRLLEDENPWVRQESLESFEYLAQTCPNEDFVTRMAAAVTRKPLINNFLPAYLESIQYYDLRGFSNVQTYMRHLSESSRVPGHSCYRYDECERNEKLPRMKSQSGSTEDLSSKDLDQRVDKVCEELREILPRKNAISSEVLRRLRSISERILESTKNME